MEPVTVRPATFAEIESAPNLPELLAEYGATAANYAIGEPAMQTDIYRTLEASGSFHLLCAYLDGELVGYLSLIFSVWPHFGKRIATVESFFVASKARKSGAGLALLHMAETIAKEGGAVGMFVSAPERSPLSKVLPRVGFAESNRVFYRGLK